MQRKGRQQSASNINININLKVESKNSQLLGRKITNTKDIQQKAQEMMRSNISSETLAKKKLSAKMYHRHKQSVEEFVNQHAVSYEQNNSDEENTISNMQREVVVAKQNVQKSRERKKMKSKSLESLRLRLNEKSLEKSRHSNSKSKSKSKKKQNNSPKSFIRTGKDPKSQEKDHSYSKSHSKSKSKSRSISKSPLIHKKKSLQIFKISDNPSSREKNRSKQRKSERSKDKLPAKKSNPDIFKEKVKTLPNNNNINPTKKYSDQIKKRLGTKKLSNNQNSKASKKQSKQQIKAEQPKPSKEVKHKSGKKAKKQFIYPERFLIKMAVCIQKNIRAFLFRKRFSEQLAEITSKIYQIRQNLKIPNWQSESNNSIIWISQQADPSTIKKQSNILEKGPNIGNSVSQRNFSGGMSAFVQEQLQKLKRKFSEQEDRVKVLELENKQLKANLHKVYEKPAEQQTKKIVGAESSIIREISNKSDEEIEELQLQSFKKSSQRRKKQLFIDLPAAIKTEESKNDSDLEQMKKKVQSYQCSPRCASPGFKFSKQAIKSLFSKQEEKLNEKYFRKSNDLQSMLQNQIISPKSYAFYSQQLKHKLEQGRQQALRRFREAETALISVAEIQEEEGFSSIELPYKKQNFNSRNSNKQSPKKSFNLFINVDEIDSQSQKYPPVLTHNPQRQIEDTLIRQEDDLSQLYIKAMEKTQNKKADHYLNQNEDELQTENHQREKSKEKNEEQNNDKIEQIQCKIGFATDLRYVRLFYIKFCQFFRSNTKFTKQVIDTLSTQIQFDLDLFLRSYRINMPDGQQNVFPYFKQLAAYNLAVPVQFLQAFYAEQINPESMYFNSNCLQLKNSLNEEIHSLGYSLFELKQYHDLALIDAFNEALNFERPGGAEGSNLQIFTQQYKNIFKDKVSRQFKENIQEEAKEESLNEILGRSIGMVINEWAFNLCGFFNDSNDPNEQVEEEKIEQIRQDRLTIMMQRAIGEEEQKLLNMGLFQFQVRYECSRKIFDQVISEIGKDLRKIVTRQLLLF